ncbi:MAG: ComEA family DNA-binding protein, partial [Boseongicola sp.]
PVVLSDGVRVIAPVASSATLHQVDLSTLGPDMITIALADGVSDGIALVRGGTSDHLASIDATAMGLRLVDLTGATVGSVALDHAPVDLAVTAGGTIAYVLVSDGDDNFVQAVPLAPLKAGKTGVASDPEPVGDRSNEIVLAGSRLWIPYLGADVATATGGVAVLDISETDCKGQLFREGCPGCDSGDCVVLATIRNYRPGDRLLDMPVPASDPADGTAHIDNLLGRKRLPSTQAIAEALLCVMDSCCHGDVVEPMPTPDPAPDPDPDPGPDPAPPPFELPEVTRICAISWPNFGVADETNFPTVPVRFSEDQETFDLPGFLIAFDRQTNMHSSIPPQIHASGNPDDYARYMTSLVKLRVGLIGDAFSPIEDPDYTLWADVPMAAIPVELALSGHDPSTGTCKIDEVIRVVIAAEDPAVTGTSENGLLAVPFANISAEGLRDLFYRQIINSGTVNIPPVQEVIYRFELIFDGDMLLDTEGKPIDAEHVAPFLPNRGSGNRWPGGQFKSTFFFNAPPQVPGINIQNLMFGGNSDIENDTVVEEEAVVTVGINSASSEELVSLNRVGPELAAAIINARPIRNEKELLAISGIGPSLLSSLRNSVKFD